MLSAASIGQGSCLPAFNLTDRGDVASVDIHAFSAGADVAAATEQMSDAAERDVRVSNSNMALRLPLHAAVESTHTLQARWLQVFPTGRSASRDHSRSAVMLGAAALWQRS